jgi:chromosomal replication initiation ATPase DnaA
MNYAYNEDKMLSGIRAFREEIKDTPKPKPKSRYDQLPNHMRTIVRTVARYFAIETADILSGCREPNLVLARWVVTYLARQQNHSYPQIGRFLGRHHSTIMYSQWQAVEQYEHNPAFREAVDAIKVKSA